MTSHSFQHYRRYSSALSCHKRSHCGCFKRSGAHRSAISAFNPLAAQRYVLCRQKFSSKVRQWWGQPEHLQRSTSNVGKNGQVDVLKSVYQTVPYLLIFQFIYFRVGLAWHTICIYHSISAFLEPNHYHVAFDYPIIFKLMQHFYLQCPPSHKHFSPCDVKCLLSFLVP